MAGDITEQKKRVEQLLADARWKLLGDDNFAAGATGEDFRILTRKVEGVPWECLDAALQYLAAQTSFDALKIEGKPYAGTWWQGHVWWERNQRKADDADLTLLQLLVCGAGSSWRFVTPNSGGSLVATVVRDMTKAGVDALLAALVSTNNNASGFSYDRDTGRWSGSISTRGADSGDAVYFDRGWFYELMPDFRWDHGGRLIKEIWRITCCYKLANGQGNGLGYYHHGGNNPTLGDAAAAAALTDAEKVGPPLVRNGWSFFDRIGGDKYYFKRTVKAELMTVDTSSIYELSGRGTMVNVVSNAGSSYT